MTTPSQTAQPTYIWQQPGWPTLVFDTGALAHDLPVAHLQMGRVLGLLDATSGRRAADTPAGDHALGAKHRLCGRPQWCSGGVVHADGRVGGQACRFDTSLRGLMPVARLRCSAVAACSAQSAMY